MGKFHGYQDRDHHWARTMLERPERVVDQMLRGPVDPEHEAYAMLVRARDLIGAAREALRE